MQELVCNVNPFVLKQKIYIVNSETHEKELITTCNFSDLTETLKSLVSNDQVYTLHLMGEQRFVEIIGDEIQNFLELNFGLADIYIKYNE